VRVLVISNHFFADQNQWASALVRMGVDVHMLGPVDGYWPQGFAGESDPPEGVVAHRYAPRVLRRSADHLWWQVPHLSDVVSHVRPDVVHVQSEAWGLLVSQALATNTPVVVHGADNLFEFGPRWESKIRTTVARRNLRRIAGYVSWNQAGLELARRFGLPACAIGEVTPAYAPSPDLLSSMATRRGITRRTLAIGDGTFALGFVGRLNVQKGFDHLLEAGRQLHDELDEGFRLIALGDGPLAATFKDSHVPWLQPMGARPWRETAEVLAAMDALAMPSVTLRHPVEQFGRVVVEAFFAGVPVVASDSGALPEVVGEAGLIVPEGDPERLADAVLQMVKSPELRDRLSEAGHDRAALNYSPEAVATRLLSVWERVC
jgi:glycosyltransferase involved in cell wall biosynthesis